MLYFTTEGCILKNGLNIVRVSDGGTSFKFRWKDSLWYMRIRGKNKAKPRIIFGKLSQSPERCFEFIGRLYPTSTPVNLRGNIWPRWK